MVGAENNKPQNDEAITNSVDNDREGEIIFQRYFHAFIIYYIYPLPPKGGIGKQRLFSEI